VNLDPGTTKNDQPRTIPLARELVGASKRLKAIHDLNCSDSESVSPETENGFAPFTLPGNQPASVQVSAEDYSTTFDALRLGIW